MTLMFKLHLNCAFALQCTSPTTFRCRCTRTLHNDNKVESGSEKQRSESAPVV